MAKFVAGCWLSWLNHCLLLLASTHPKHAGLTVQPGFFVGADVHLERNLGRLLPFNVTHANRPYGHFSSTRSIQETDR